MDRNEESAQDVDITILPDTEQPRSVADSGDMLPHFQFLDGGGSLQNSTERPIEGFVALKTAYEHVFKKQREQTRLLHKKNQQLVSEIQQLKRGRGMVTVGAADGAVTSEHIQISNDQAPTVAAKSVETFSNEDSKELDLQVAILEENKAKLRAGLVRFANFLLKKEPTDIPLSDLLKKIIENIHSLQCDSEDNVRNLCSLVEEMYNLDDSNKFECNQEAGQRQIPATYSSKDASLQQIVTKFQQIELPERQDSDYESQKKTSQQEQHCNVTGQLDREKSQDEDMYGAEGNSPGNSDLVPYNFIRLHFKLMKLQQFPAEYKSMAQQLSSVSMQQQRRASCNSWNSSILSSPRNIRTETKPVSSASGLPASQMSSFVGIHGIKMPPSDLAGQQDISEKNAGQAAMYNPADTVRYNQNMPLMRNPSPSEYTIRPRLSEPGITQVKASNHILRQQPTSRRQSDQRFPTNDTNIEHVKSPNDHFTFNQARDPPNHSENTHFGANNFPVVSSVYHPPLSRGSVDHQQTHTRQSFDFTPTAVGSEYPQSPFIPGSDSTRDQLVTAHTIMRNVSVNAMECPVCCDKFPQGTSEETVTSHVNSHFEEPFELLNA